MIRVCLFLLGFLSIHCAVEGSERWDIRSGPSARGFVTRYAFYDHEVQCIRGEVVIQDGAHVSTVYEIIYKKEAVAQVAMAPGYENPKIVLLQHARQYEGTYRGRPITWLHVWDRIHRRVPLPGSGFYVIDPDGHIRKPKPEELIAIQESQRK